MSLSTMNLPSPLDKENALFVPFPLCTIETSTHELSERLQIPLLSWEEPGMGKASGFSCRLASGAAVFLEEFEHARKQLGSGPAIYVEASQLIDCGIEFTLNETLSGLSIPEHCVSWVQTEDGLQAAKLAVQAATSRKTTVENGI